MTDVTADRSGQIRSTRELSTYLPFAGRLMMAAIFVLSGLGKIAAPAATIGYIGSVGLPLPAVGYALATLVEVVGGLALMAGYRVRPVAIILAAFAVVTALAFHRALADQNQMIHFMKNIAIAGGLLQIAAFGGGAFALDRR